MDTKIKDQMEAAKRAAAANGHRLGKWHNVPKGPDGGGYYFAMCPCGQMAQVDHEGTEPLSDYWRRLLKRDAMGTECSRAAERIAAKLAGASISILAQAEGTDATCNDIVNAAKEHGISGTCEPLALEDAEYSEAWRDADGLESADASGILPISKGLRCLYDMGAWHEDVGTMGTLGGPLGGLVPDLSFAIESQNAVSSVRATAYRGSRLLCDELADLLRDPFVAGDPETAARLIEEAEQAKAERKAKAATN